MGDFVSDILLCMDKDLLEFLKSERVLILATHDTEPWVTNVFYGVNDDGRIYFISNKDTLHGKHILAGSNVAFSVVWFNEKDFKDRVGVQGKGVCKVAETDEEIKEGVRLHNELYPEFKAKITFRWAKMMGYRVWYIDPNYIKFWNDGLFGSDEYKEYKF